MGDPRHLAKYWAEHPELERGRMAQDFPFTGTLTEKLLWYEERFIRMTWRMKDGKDRAALLKLAYDVTRFMATQVKMAGDGAVETAYREHLQRIEATFEEHAAHRRSDALNADPNDN